MNLSPEWLFNTDAPGGAIDIIIEHLQLGAFDASSTIERTASSFTNADRLCNSGSGPVIALSATTGNVTASDLVAIADALPACSVLHVFQREYVDPRRPNIVARLVPATTDREFLLKIAGHLHKLVQGQPAGSRFVPAEIEFPRLHDQCSGLDNYEPKVGERCRVSLKWEGVRYDFFSDLRPGSRRLVVFGQDAIDRTKISLPHFYRWSWLPELQASAIIFNAPSLYAADHLLAGWWVGTRTRDYVREAVAIVRRAMQSLNVPPEEVTFFGASAGGFSALGMAAALPGARAIVDIPQVCLATYGARIASDASILAGLGYARAEDVPPALRHRVDIIDRFVHEQNVPEFLYLQNSRDQTHIGAQMGTFLQRLGELMSRAEWAQRQFRVEVYSAWNLLKGGHFPLSRADTLRHINSYISMPSKVRRQGPAG